MPDQSKHTHIKRRCAPALRPEEFDRVADMLRGYARALGAKPPHKTPEVNAHREREATAALFLADNITRTSHETVTTDEAGNVICVQGFARTDAPPGRVPSEYTRGDQSSDIAILRDLK